MDIARVMNVETITKMMTPLGTRKNSTIQTVNDMKLFERQDL